MVVHQPMDEMEKDVACSRVTDVVATISALLADPTLRVAIANIHRTAVVPTIRHRLAAMTMMVADANIHPMVVVLIKLLQLKDLNMKDARVIHSNSDVVRMALQFRPAHTITDVIVHKLNINAVPMALHLHKDPIPKVAHAHKANMVAVWMALRPHRAHDLKDVKKCQPNHKKLVAIERMAATVPIILSSTSLMPNMVAVPDSGTAAVVAMTIVSKQLRIARVRVRNQLVRVLAHYQKVMGHVLDIIQYTTTIPIEMLAHNSYSVVVWVIIIDLKRWKLAKNFAW